MTREEMWKEFENQLISETRTPITMSFDNAEKLTKLGIKETVAKWKRRLEQTRWIPVSERLPKAFQPILVTSEAFHWANEPVTYSVKQTNFGGIVDFIAWMPLPQPYKAESER